MNSFKQWTELNNTIDGFYADYSKESEPAMQGDTQLETLEEEYEMNNSSSNRRQQQANRLSADYSSVFPTPDNNLHLESSSAVALRGVNISAAQKKKEEDDEYLNMHGTAYPWWTEDFTTQL
jgi:hypothetical protein